MLSEFITNLIITDVKDCQRKPSKLLLYLFKYVSNTVWIHLNTTLFPKDRYC